MLPETYEICPKCGHATGNLAEAIADAEDDLRVAVEKLHSLCRTLEYEEDIVEKRDAAEQMREPAEKILRGLDAIYPLWKNRDGR